MSIPPSVVVPNLAETRKKKKRFKLPTNNVDSVDSEAFVSSNRVLVQPHIHFGLDRFMTVFGFMDKYNEFNHSPTLLSIGGSGYDGYNMELLALNLDDKSLDKKQEFEWKVVTSHNLDIFSRDYFAPKASNASIVYSRRHQKLFCFMDGNHVYALCLKSLVWKIITFSLGMGSYVWVFSATNLGDDKHVLICSNQTNMILVDLDEINNALESGLHNVSLQSFKQITSSTNLNVRALVPLNSEMDLFSTGCRPNYMSFDEESYAQLLGLPTSKMEHLTAKEIDPSLTTVIHYYHNAISVAEEELCSEPKELLISFYSKDSKTLYLYTYNVATQKFTRYCHNPIPIEVDIHKLFIPSLFTFVNKKSEKCAVYIPNNDIVYMIKLDYLKISNAFPLIDSDSIQSLSDVVILH